MTSRVPLPDVALHLTDLVKTVMSEIRPRLVDAALSRERAENKNIRHEGNFLSAHDIWMHERYKKLISSRIPSYIYASEEADPQVIGTDRDPDLCVLVDPLDTSELAVRALHGYTHAMIYSRALSRPIAAVVGDIFHHLQVYVAARDQDGQDQVFVVTRDGDHHPLHLGESQSLPESLITNYLMKPTERFLPMAKQTHLLQALGQRSQDGLRRGRLGVDFGSIGLCHVAAGFTDAMVEFAKGFAIWDLAPGHYILNAAGGAVLDLEGRPIPLDYRLDTLADINAAMNKRQRFVAATDLALAQSILHTMVETGMSGSA
ncbi:hypothetical protein Acor_55010 [Acrocarpospora corrugata]|uniref:Inositol monophosphatase n=1 Tax=Acrocarpospora corrugata TaxID=35763 RepID=A0A5M3W329_9ACTN|nr:inositol monophosphatase family protein [Acrocarpospora corrugata]GES03435.1 hypothetical protein Acor_55010 [Acrocarpospora corrugata]